MARSTVEQIEDNLGAAGWTLASEHVERLTRAGDRAPHYPYDLQ